MKRWMLTFGSLALAVVATALAQPPEGPGGPEGRSGPPPNPVIDVLDSDHDHVISADELKKASETLAKLDKNKDGKLTEDEFRPMRRGGEGGRGPDGPPPGGPRGEGRPPQGRGPGGEGPEGRGPEGRGPGGPGGPDGPPMGPDPKRMVEHAMEFDTDKDGKLSKAELLKFAEDFASHHPGPGGPGGPGGGGPGNRRGPGGRPMGPGGEGRPNEGAPERPKRPE